MSKKMMRTFLLAGGIVLVILSLGADFIGIGSRPGIHWKQLLGAALGLAAIIAGFWLGRNTEKEK